MGDAIEKLAEAHYRILCQLDPAEDDAWEEIGADRELWCAAMRAFISENMFLLGEIVDCGVLGDRHPHGHEVLGVSGGQDVVRTE